ncbi:transcription elongation factor 1 [Kipferlia bialata]|uniref:Transcription elongation factor 1 n=1 Tax=Kipferlia bialata TaxID=797122 RepID=A0A9K3CXK2_9EUKA|nr:transcription elongation factor 1 [Kipferlia bialata]GIQ83744.1 transcription elongation factor 1 [Kipferlia bialata]GIQ84887.1 transcription elongation factor 1 [Kipferlia bialata]|eukprot:g2688.t1
MGGKSKSIQFRPRKRQKLEEVFDCPYCRENLTVVIKILNKIQEGHVRCNACGQTYNTAVGKFDKPIDVYMTWVDLVHELHTAAAAPVKALDDDEALDDDSELDYDRHSQAEESEGLGDAPGRTSNLVVDSESEEETRPLPPRMDSIERERHEEVEDSEGYDVREPASKRAPESDDEDEDEDEDDLRPVPSREGGGRGKGMMQPNPESERKRQRQIEREERERERDRHRSTGMGKGKGMARQILFDQSDDESDEESSLGGYDIDQ